MSYSLKLVHWKIGSNGDNSVVNKYSLHLDDGDFVAFSKRIITEGLKQDPIVKYKTEGVTDIPHAAGNLYNEVKKAHDSGKPGIWKEPEEIGRN